MQPDAEPSVTDIDHTIVVRDHGNWSVWGRHPGDDYYGLYICTTGDNGTSRTWARHISLALNQTRAARLAHAATNAERAAD